MHQQYGLINNILDNDDNPIELRKCHCYCVGREAGRHAVLLLLSIWMMRMTILLYVDDDGNTLTPDRKEEESMAIKV